MPIFSNAVGRKVLVAVSGFFLVLFVIVHLLGNLSIFAGPDGINAYADALHGMGPFVWIFRAFMFAMLGIHVWFGVLLTLENRAANPRKYAVKRKLRATFAGENMIWTGVLLLVFLVYHVLQFTVHVTPDVVVGMDAMGRVDVYTMVVNSFGITPIVLFYVAAMVVLFLHVSHGIQSLFQTVGLSNDRTLPLFTRIGMGFAVVFLVGYSAIPVLIFAGFLAR
jgi:succinate dehydrogenase / fumarate reductase, cytochrome b subunit